MSRKMVLVLSLLVVLCMAFLGVTYAAWTQALLIDGTVATGTLDVDLVDGEVAMNGDNASVGTCTAESTDDYSFDVTVGNSYDGFTCHIPMAVENSGTIPVNVPVPQLTWTDPAGDPPAGVTVALDGCWIAEVDLDHDLSTVTIEEAAYVNCKVSVHVGDGALEGDSFAFHYDFTVEQFNK